MTRSTGRWARRDFPFLIFILPAFALYTLFVVFPMGKSVFFYSFAAWNPVHNLLRFNGVQNFTSLVTDANFLGSVLFTLKYALMNVVLSNAVALFLAICIQTLISKRAGGFVRSLFFIPNVISSILVAFTWQFIFTGLYPEIVKGIGLPSWDISWFGSGIAAFSALLTVSVWQTIGFLMLIYVARLQTVPLELYEAAEIDGASWGRRMRHVAVPMIVPMITINLFLSISSSLKMFDLAFALTRGGPARLTETVTLNLYYEAYRSFNFGYACAKALVLMIVISAIAYFQLRVTGRREVTL